MAITILESPLPIQPVYNPIIIALNSDKKTETNFQYLLEFVIDGVTITPKIELSSNPDGYGVANIQNHLAPYVSSSLDASSLVTFRRIEDNYIEYSVNLYEEYDVSGVTTQFSAATCTATTYAYQSVMPTLDFTDYDNTDYYMSSATTGTFLTSIPSEGITTRENDMIFVNYFNNSTNTSNYLEVTTSNGGVYRIANALQVATSSTKFLSIGVGPWHLKNTSSTITMMSGTYPIIQDSTDSYTFRLLDTYGNPTSESKTVYIDRTCSRFDIYNLLYRDTTGAFLNFNFELAHKLNKSVEKKKYYQNVGSFSPSTLVWGYNTYDRGTTTIGVTSKDKYNVTSNWVTEFDGDRIGNLLESPEVYQIQDGTVTYANAEAAKGITTYINDSGLLKLYLTSHGYVVGDLVQLTDTNSAYNNKYMYVTAVADVNNFTLNFPYSTNSMIGVDKATKQTITATAGRLIGVDILTSSMEILQKSTAKLINYSIDFEYSFLNNSQK